VTFLALIDDALPGAHPLRHEGLDELAQSVAMERREQRPRDRWGARTRVERALRCMHVFGRFVPE
jgi:hypothetical protein